MVATETRTLPMARNPEWLEEESRLRLLLARERGEARAIRVARIAFAAALTPIEYMDALRAWTEGV